MQQYRARQPIIDSRCKSCHKYIYGLCPGEYPADELECWQSVEDEYESK